MKKIKICHITTVHSVFDPRIFYKECVWLAKAGYSVHLIVKNDRDMKKDGVIIHAIDVPNNRFLRMILAPWLAYKKAIGLNAALYHFHDPELIPIGLLLRLRGKPVIYDIHEDISTAILVRPYLPKLIRCILSKIVSLIERYASPFFNIVLAERYYKEKFHKGVTVLNYPISVNLEGRSKKPINALIYTGSIREDRGALIYAEIVKKISDIDVYLIGRCSAVIKRKLQERLGEDFLRLHIIGGEEFVDQGTIEKYQNRYQWIAGLAIFPDSSHFRRKELTKFFEYMSAGIPIICSNFQTWKDLIHGIGSGICVDSADMQDIVKAVRKLMNNREMAKKMSMNGIYAVNTKYLWKHEFEKLLSLYSEIMEQ